MSYSLSFLLLGSAAVIAGVLCIQVPSAAQGTPGLLQTQSGAGSIKARQKFAVLLQTIFDKVGRPISVRATGPNQQTLLLSSGLIYEGSYNLEATRRETIDCEDCMLLMKKAGFKRLIIRGTEAGYEESYPVR